MVAWASYDLDIEKLGDVAMQIFFFSACIADMPEVTLSLMIMSSFLVLGFPAPSYFYWSIYTSH